MRKTRTVLRRLPVLDYAAEGKSMTKHEGKVIFVEGAVPGDVVDVQLSKNKKDWAEGRAVEFHAFSQERVQPFCEHFGVCGGCKWQMLPYEKQLQYKQNEVEQHLRRIGKIPLPESAPILGAHPDRRYRNKLEFTFSNRRYLTDDEIRSQALIEPQQALGFHVPRVFDKVIDINTCHLMAEPANVIKNCIRRFAKTKEYTFYDVKAHTGWLRNLILRITTTGEVMVNVVFNHDDPEPRKELLDYLLQEVPSVTTLLYTINPKWNDSIHDLDPQVYHGKGYVIEQMEEFRFKIGPKSFFQTNTFQGEQLYRITREYCELAGNETVYDLYCGTGSIGIFVSRSAKKIVGVEVLEEAVADARENALLNNISQARFFAGDVADVCDDAFFEQEGRPDVIITDPPRAGMHDKLLQKILDMEASRVVYVSCNPATQARDLNRLDEKYMVTRMQPVDMFPHTHHIENVVQLKLR